jgi:glycosyltransferase involved in cell wall biosynthesis
MKILYDHQIFSWQKHGGISRYFVELFHRLPKYEAVIITSVLFTENEHFVNIKYHKILKIIEKIIGPFLKPFVAKTYTLLNIMFRNYDVYHPTQHDYSYIRYCKKPYVVTVYDMTAEIFPQYFVGSKKSDLKLICEKANHIIAISETTKNDIVKLFCIAPERISTIYLAGSINKQVSCSKNQVCLSKQLLFVGYRSHYKNFAIVLQLLRYLIGKKHQLSLLCVGGNGFNSDELSLIKQLNLKEVVNQKQLSENGLAAAYQNSLALIYPSFYEGFGLPIIEAMSFQCPLIVSDIPVFREIARNAALFFDPHNPKEAAEKVEEVLIDHQLRKRLVNLGKMRAADFSWEKTAQETAKIYRMVASN